MDPIHAHRPRNVGWARAAALLYGDWGTSKAYVIGAAFLAVKFAALPIIIAVCLLTGLVGLNYIVVCRSFPDGGGVYSSARMYSRTLAVVGALFLVANLTVTAALSGWAAMAYFRVPPEFLAHATIGVILLIGALNMFGPKHSGSMAVVLALPAVFIVVFIALLSAPHLTTAHLETLKQDFSKDWIEFVGVILALSGVEAIANLTGVMKLDPGATMEKPCVVHTARKAILVVSVEVVLGTIILGWAMLSLSPDKQNFLVSRWDDMLTVLAEQYGALALGPAFGKLLGFVTAIVVGFLLLSAVNTAITALIGLLYMLGSDDEMPRGFTRLNHYGVPLLPVLLATVIPILIVIFSPDQISLMQLYAIGVVGAITINLGSCALNRQLALAWHERGLMAVTSLVLFAVELTLAKTRPNALFFIVCVLMGGLGLRAFAQRKRHPAPALPAPTGTTVPPFPAAALAAGDHPAVAPLGSVQTIMVAARGFTPVVRFAIDEAIIRHATLYLLYVRQVAVSLPVGGLSGTGPARWQDDREAALIMASALSLVKDTPVNIQPLYVVSNDPAETILDLTDELHVDLLMLGVSHRASLTRLLSGNIVHEVAERLPNRVQLVIHG